MPPDNWKPMRCFYFLELSPLLVKEVTDSGAGEGGTLRQRAMWLAAVKLHEIMTMVKEFQRCFWWDQSFKEEKQKTCVGMFTRLLVLFYNLFSRMRQSHRSFSGNWTPKWTSCSTSHSIRLMVSNISVVLYTDADETQPHSSQPSEHLQSKSTSFDAAKLLCN